MSSWSLAKIELYKISRQKYSYILIIFVLFNAALVGIGSRVFPAILSAMRGEGGGSFDGYTFASIIASGTFSSAGAGTLAMLAFSGSMIASETDSGTLKNILVRPVGRMQFVLSKALALFFYCLVIVIVTAILSIVASSLFYGLGNRVIPETGEVFRTRAQMLGNMCVAYLMDLFSIYTVGCLGLFLSVLINNTGWAVITSLVLYFPIMFLKNFEIFSPWIFTAYMDKGQYILRGMAILPSVTWAPEIYYFFSVTVPTIAVLLGLSLFFFNKKEIQ